MFNNRSSQNGANNVASGNGASGNGAQNSGVEGAAAKAAVTPSELKSRWASQTKREVMTESEFIARKTHQDFFVVGVTGFIEEWARANLRHDVLLTERITSARERLKRDLAALRDEHGDRMVVATHGVRCGMPEMVQEVCTELRIPSVGLTSVQSFGSSGPMVDTIVVAGQQIADESAPLVRISDRLLVLGGGEIAKAEALAFSRSGPDAWKNLFLYKNYGGPAGKLGGLEISGMFVMS